ncbi:hypothetical protein ACFWOY_23300 [Streptomyces sp. NPDC058423]|uniref:hypothetical protein n=1 Tax=unclassified Streptomyces TaxID=2593676 RepID=UPI00365C72F5
MSSSAPEGEFVPYEQARKEFTTHAVAQAEVPVGHFVSLPLPTLRWADPGYAGFAAPAVRTPGQPLVLGTPDRWWALGGRRRALLAYGLTAAVPFSAELRAGPVTVVSAGRSVASARENLRMLDECLNEAAPAFFRGEPGTPVARGDLDELLAAVLPAETLPWYRALTPDFFNWLEG